MGAHVQIIIGWLSILALPWPLLASPTDRLRQDAPPRPSRPPYRRRRIAMAHTRLENWLDASRR